MKRALIASGLVFGWSLPALAGMTTIHSPSHVPSELNIEQILEAHYGGDFTLSGEDFLGGGAGGTINAIRWDDFLDPIGQLSAVNPSSGSAADQIWRAGDITATAIARFAGNTQQFGFDRGSGFELLFDVSGYDMGVSGAGSANLLADTWRWIRRSSDGSDAFDSQPSLNADGLDHMVTYRITGLPTDQTVWLLCFEDIFGGLPNSDRDFNDLVVEVRAVPEPATLGFLVAGGLALLGARRRR
jgi:hypothetical protein